MQVFTVEKFTIPTCTDGSAGKLAATPTGLSLTFMCCLQVWSVLTDYKRLTEYVPNLDVCERLKGGTKTRYKLRQVRIWLMRMCHVSMH
jgi:hypothetical protein